MGYAILAIVVILVLFFIVEFNIIKGLQHKVSQSKSGIDVALKNRFDLIPNLVECVKGYCEHEEKVLVEVTKEREAFYKNNNLEEGMNLSAKCNQILALSEKYPDLKSNSNFLELQASLNKIEIELSASRRLYNSDCTMFNTKIDTFPGNIVAGIMGARPEQLFEIENPQERENVQIKF